MTTSRKFLFLACIVALMSPLAARATGITVPVAVTLTLTHTPNGIYYPYDFTIQNGSTYTRDVAMSYLSFNRSVNADDPWNATAEGLGYLLTSSSGEGEVDGSTMTSLEEDANLDSLYGTGPDSGASNDQIQIAIWDILDPSAFKHSLDKKESTLVSDATVFAASTPNTSSFYSQFTFYYPSTDNGSNNEPQQFMESSLVLLGTGMAGLVWIVRRRMLAARV